MNKCRYKNRSKEKVEDEHRFHQGIVLGICPSTGQYIIHDSDKHVIRFARTIMCLSDELKWDMTGIESISVTPFDQHAAHDPEDAFQ